MGKPKRRIKTRGQARFIREKEMEATSSSSSPSTPARKDEESDQPSDQDESGDVVANNKSKNVDSEAELELELAELEKQKRDLRKAELKSKIDKVKNDIASMSQNSSQLRFSKAGSGSRQGAKSGRINLQGDQAVTLNDLRELECLQEEVSSRMHEAGQLFDDDIDQPTEGDKSKKGKKSGIFAKSCDTVVSPQLWPHCFLEYHFVNKSVEYRDIDFHSFIAGELEILTLEKLTSIERQCRLKNLKQIVYLESTYEWEALRDMHAAKLRLIERGSKTWDSDFSNLENQMLAPYIKAKRYNKFQLKTRDYAKEQG